MAVKDSAVAAASVQAGDSLVTEDTPTVEVAEEVAAVEDSAPVEDTVALPPYEIDAERFILEGRRYFRAGGNVVVVRDSLLTFGDSLDYDQEVGSMSIIGDARVEGHDFQLMASTVSVTPSAGLKEELLARRQARLSGQQVDMIAPAIRMFLDNGQVDRIVAIEEIPPLPGEPQGIDTEGLSPGDAARVLARAEAATRETDSLAVADSLFRPSVAAAQFNLSGDSIDVLSPGQVLDLVTAVGAARAEGQPDDSVAAHGLPEVARRDWMEGDTIYARFVTPGSADSTATPDSADAAPDSADAAAAPTPAPPPTAQRTALAPRDHDRGGERPQPVPPGRFRHGAGRPRQHAHRCRPCRGRCRYDRDGTRHDAGRWTGFAGAALGGGPEDHRLYGGSSGGEDGCGRSDGGVSSGADSTCRAPGFRGRRSRLGHCEAGFGHGASGHRNWKEGQQMTQEQPLDLDSGATAVLEASTLRGGQLTKIYKKRRVVSDVDIQVRQGEIVGLLGPNGAGKTTTFYMLVGLITPGRPAGSIWTLPN